MGRVVMGDGAAVDCPGAFLCISARWHIHFSQPDTIGWIVKDLDLCNPWCGLSGFPGKYKGFGRIRQGH